MLLREMRPSDIETIEEIYARSPSKYDIPLLDSKYLDTALVAVDDEDRPRMLLAAEQVAELFLVIDHEWEKPAFRLVALAALTKEIRRRLESKGYRSAYAFLGPDVPAGYDRKLFKFGARKMIWRCLKFLRGEG